MSSADIVTLKLKRSLFRAIRSVADVAARVTKPVFQRNQWLMSVLLRINSRLLASTTLKVPDNLLASIREAADIEGEKGVNVLGFISAESGVGEAARANIRAIESVCVPFALNNLVSHSRQGDGSYKDFSTDNPYCFNLVHVNAENMNFILQEKGIEYFVKRYNIGFWYWELSKFPLEWDNSYRFYNEIWVASDFCKDSIAERSPVPVVKIPPSVVVDKAADVDRPYFDIAEDDFVFFFMFDFFSFFERKNPLAVIEAFRAAFRPDERARLVIKCSNSDWNSPARKVVVNAAKGLNVKFIDRYLDKEELHALVSLSDCYVALHRSEGFGLPIAEAMYFGKPVIATGYSGNMEFMNEDNSLPVRYRLVEIEKDFGPYRKGNVWAEPDVAHASELMRRVFDDRKFAQKVGKAAGKYIRKNLSPEAAGKRIKKRLADIVREKKILDGKFL